MNNILLVCNCYGLQWGKNTETWRSSWQICHHEGCGRIIRTTMIIITTIIMIFVNLIFFAIKTKVAFRMEAGKLPYLFVVLVLRGCAASLVRLNALTPSTTEACGDCDFGDCDFVAHIRESLLKSSDKNEKLFICNVTELVAFDRLEMKSLW